MESILGELAGLVSYFILGILFFSVTWGFVEKITQTIFTKSNVGWLLGLLIASYGFWYPVMAPLRIPYLIFLTAVAMMSTGFSRFSIVAEQALCGNRTKVAGVVIALLTFEIIYYLMPEFLVISGYNVIGNAISWILLVYGITRTELIGPAIENVGLPRARFIHVAFVLACVVFVPIEFPEVYTLISMSAVSGALFGWVHFKMYRV